MGIIDFSQTLGVLEFALEEFWDNASDNYDTEGESIVHIFELLHNKRSAKHPQIHSRSTTNHPQTDPRRSTNDV